MQLSVIIPCHNDGRYLTEAVESVLTQESPVKDMEVIVVDDHSSDPKTLEVLARLNESDPMVRVIHNPGRLGPAAASNFGVASAKSEWIAFLEADDLWLPGSLESRWQVVETEADAQWISADFEIVSEDKSLIFDSYYRKFFLEDFILRPDYESGKVLRLSKPVREAIALKGMIAWAGAVIVRKSLFLAVGGFDEDLYKSHDVHFWVRLASEADLFFVPRTVARWRWRRGSLTWHERRGKSSTDPYRDSDTCWDGQITAFTKLMREKGLRPYRISLRNRLLALSVFNAHYYWRHGRAWPALGEAARVLRWASIKPSRWKLVAQLVFSK